MTKKIEIRVGSDSDIPKISETFDFLKDLGIDYSTRILSAHRTPDRMTKEAQNLEKKGFKVSIAAAGGSAHLAGMTASETCVPVIALPVKSSLGGLDSLLSMVQMPPGIPNGCVGINEAKNSAILATRIAFLDDEKIREKLSKKLGTKIISKLEDKPKIDIITDQKNLDLSLLDKLGIEYNVNPEEHKNSVVLCIMDVDKLSEKINEENEQITIIVPISNSSFKIENLKKIIRGPYAWMGVDRTQNGMLYAAQILGNHFPKVRTNFKNYRKKLYNQVVEKDKELQK